MSLLNPCDACGSRAPGKLANCTWAWYRADNVRVAYRQRVCTTCFAMTIAPLEVNTREFSTTCPACHIDTSVDMDPVYLTTFVPSVGKLRLELPLCATCAVEVRGRALSGSRKLEEGFPESEGRGPQTEDTWTALGIQPR